MARFGSPGAYGSPNGHGPSPLGAVFGFGKTPLSSGNRFPVGFTPGSGLNESPMMFSDDGTPLSDIGDIHSIYSTFSPSLFFITTW